MTKGFIKLHYGLLDWEWYNDLPTKTLFLHFLLKANYKENNWKGIKINRGELVSGRKVLALETGLSEQQVKTALNKLKSTGEITTRTTNRYTVIKLESYCLYQDKKPETNQQITSSQPTNNQQITNRQPTNNHTIRKKEKKEEKELLSKDNICGKFESKKINDEFEEIWKNYLPVKTKDGGFTGKGDKKPALAEFERICKKADDNIFEKISLGVKNYLQECSQTSTRTKHFVRFLKNETWKEYQTLQNQAVICSEDKDEKRFNELMEALN